MEGIVLSLYDFFSNTDALIKYGGLGFVLLFIYLETAFFIGIVLPGGDYFVFTSGLLCGSRFIDFPLPLVIVLAIIAAISGDYTGYLQGRVLGKKLYQKKDTWIFKKSYLTRSEAVYRKYGPWTFILGKYFPIVRTILPVLAGAVKVETKRFVYSTALGSIIWITLLMSLGYLLGHKFPELLNYSHYIFIIIVLLASTPLVWQAIKLLKGKLQNRKISQGNGNKSESF
jgi:membrane-associated protein